ncbi:MAG: hypothetical protein Pars2KO_33490 [Parasphingorhabdus sp.]
MAFADCYGDVHSLDSIEIKLRSSGSFAFIVEKKDRKIDAREKERTEDF